MRLSEAVSGFLCEPLVCHIVGDYIRNQFPDFPLIYRGANHFGCYRKLIIHYIQIFVNTFSDNDIFSETLKFKYRIFDGFAVLGDGFSHFPCTCGGYYGDISFHKHCHHKRCKHALSLTQHAARLIRNNLLCTAFRKR